MFARILLGNGKLNAEVRGQLEAEGLVLLEENLPGSVRYTRFRAPGRYHNGKVVPQRFALGVSEHRFVLYCRSGRTELVDSPFGEPRLEAVQVTAEGDDRVIIHIDYDRIGESGVSGEVAIHLKSGSAATIVEQLRQRIDAAR